MQKSFCILSTVLVYHTFYVLSTVFKKFIELFEAEALKRITKRKISADESKPIGGYSVLLSAFVYSFKLYIDPVCESFRHNCHRFDMHLLLSDKEGNRILILANGGNISKAVFVLLAEHGRVNENVI